MKYLQIIPTHRELSVARVWREVKANSNIMQYSSNYPNRQLPEREFMLFIVSTIHEERLRNLILEARKHRSIANLELDDELIYISANFMKSLKTLFSKTKRRFCFRLVEEEIKIFEVKKKPKEYLAQLEMLKIEQKENKQKIEIRRL